MVANIKTAMNSVDPTSYFKSGENAGWGQGLPRRNHRFAAAPVIEKHTCVLAAADVYTANTVFWVMESLRLDLGYGSQVHP